MSDELKPVDPDVAPSVPEGAEVQGSGNDARIAALNAIADVNDGERAEELADINDDGSTVPFVAPVVAETPPAEALPAETPPDETPPVEAKTFKLKVNGKELELTEAQLIERAQKVESADEYLRTAKHTTKAEPIKAGPTPEEIQRQQDEDDRALVRAIQIGTEEEATAALRKLREQSSARPSLSRDDVSRTIDERLAFNTALEKFSEKYEDVWTDPVLKKLALDKDAELLKAGDARPYYERYSEIGNEIRAWREKLVPAPVATTLTDKEARKASAPQVPVAASAKLKPAAQEEEKEEKASDVIAKMAEKRGGPQWMRS